MARFTFKEICADLWPDFEALFGAKGACGGCWCQSWRVLQGGKLWEETKGEKAHQLTRSLILTGRMTGLLAYDGDKPVGWCSYGPRVVFPRLERVKAYRRDDTEGIWSITCFFIPKEYRHKNLARQMLGAALRFMKKRHVRIVEAYPVPPTLDGTKLPGAFVWTGPLAIFEKAGFEIVQRISHSRPLVRLQL